VIRSATFQGDDRMNTATSGARGTIRTNPLKTSAGTASALSPGHGTSTLSWRHPTTATQQNRDQPLFRRAVALAT